MSSSSLRLLIAVTHLLGAGHLTRAAALARAFARRGHRVVLASGGMPAQMVSFEGVELVQLPPVRTVGTDFRTLLDENGGPVTAERLETRRQALAAALDRLRPDVLVTELFPFGRRVLAAEFLDLLDRAARLDPRPLIVSSVRDILAAPKKADRVAEAHDRVARLYDLVLVHGDPDLVPIEASWPADAGLRQLLRYTGYVDEGEDLHPSGTRAGIVVSGGSSAASLPLYEAALGAAALVPAEPWHVLVGNGVPQAQFESLRGAAQPHVTVERARRDFRTLLGRSAVSVSQAGYNTAVDLLRSGVPAVLVPFEAGKETEQRLRAEHLSARGLAEIVPEFNLSARGLADAVRSRLRRPQGESPPFRLDGARTSVTIVEDTARPVVRTFRSYDWTPLTEALSRQQDLGHGRRPQLWWRDDDAVADTPQLRRLLALTGRYDAALALAVVPQQLHPSLEEALPGSSQVSVLVHGLSHENHAPAGVKKAEFGDLRPLDDLVGDAAEGLRLLRGPFGERLVPVLVPPWNRISPRLKECLPALGYRALSTFGPRGTAEAAPGLARINTHLDPIDWHGSRSLADPAAGLRMLAAAFEAGEPAGLLTHHLVHSEELWHFCEAFMEQLCRYNVPVQSVVAFLSNKETDRR